MKVTKAHTPLDAVQTSVVIERVSVNAHTDLVQAATPLQGLSFTCRNSPEMNSDCGTITLSVRTDHNNVCYIRSVQELFKSQTQVNNSQRIVAKHSKKRPQMSILPYL
jgi:hypothetical protein